MLEAIILKLVTTLTGYLFSAALDSFKSIEIEGAPSWYGKSHNSANLYAYGYARGGIESVEIAREHCKNDMIKRLNQINEVIVYENFRNLKDPKEKALVEAFKNDPELGTFVLRSMKYEKVEHYTAKEKTLFTDARPEQTFAGGMIPKQMIIEYQKERLQKIKTSLTTMRFDVGMDELDQAFSDK